MKFEQNGNQTQDPWARQRPQGAAESVVFVFDT